MSLNDLSQGLQRSSGSTEIESINVHLPDGHYLAAGLKSSLHGVLYQLKLLMIYAFYAGKNKYEFRLATEMEDAGKFDDVVLLYKKPGTDSISMRFLQAKHTQIDNEEKVLITGQDLLTETDDKFSLQKYYISYLKIKSNFNNAPDFVICTNIDFDFDNGFVHECLKKLTHSKPLYFETVNEEDDIVNFKEGKRYRFVRKSTDEGKRVEVVAVLKAIFERTSEFTKLAAQLAICILEDVNIGFQNALFKKYQVPLTRYVIDIREQKLSQKFIDGSHARSDVEIFRKELQHACLENLKKQISETPTERNKNTIKQHKKLIAGSLDNFWNAMSKIQLKLVDSFKNTFVPDVNHELSNPEEFAIEMGRLMNKNQTINIQQGQKRGNSILNPEIYKLAGHVLVNRNDEKEVGFTNKFINGAPLPGNLETFRIKLKENVQKERNLYDYTFKITGFKTCKESEFESILQSKPSFPSPYVSDEDVESFVDKLIFAVNQPNEEKLSRWIIKKLGEHFNLNDATFLNDTFQRQMQDWMKEKQGRYLSETDILEFFEVLRVQMFRLVLIGPTLEYIKKIEEAGIEFEPKSLPFELLNFLKEDAGIVINIVNFVAPRRATILGSVKIMQLLGTIAKYRRDGSYVFFSSRTLLRLKDMVIGAVRHKGADLLIIECNSMDKELTDLLHSLKDFPIKLVLITQTDDASLFCKLNDGKEILDNSGFISLTQQSQLKLLNRDIIFQGEKTKLYSLVNINNKKLKQKINIEMFLKLINNQDIKIGTPLPISNGYNPRFYVERTFYRQIAIKPEIFNSPEANLIAENKQDFAKMCEQNPRKNIHWLEEESGRWYWQESQGSLDSLRKYINKSIIPESIDTFLRMAKPHRAMIIANSAGMGKTTVLTHLSIVIKQAEPNHWVIRIDLTDHRVALNNHQGKIFTTDTAIEFISEEILKLKDPLEKHIFLKGFQSIGTTKLVLMWDGFDEICPDYQKVVIELLSKLKTTAVEQLWITTRPHYKEELENQLQQLAFILRPFDQDNQVDFIVNFWKSEIKLPENQIIDEEFLKEFANELIIKLTATIRDQQQRLFAGIPLQARLLAESFQKKIEAKFLLNREIHLDDKLELLNLYDEIINDKINIYLQDKLKMDPNVPGTRNVYEREKTRIAKKHQQLALQVILGKPLEVNEDLFAEEVSRIGLAQMNKEGQFRFLHHTFAEYYVAEYLINQMQQQNVDESLLSDLTNVLVQNDYQVVCSFLNDQLEEKSPSNEFLKQYGRHIAELYENNLASLRCSDINNGTLLHRATAEDNTSIIEFLFNSFKENKSIQSLKVLFVAVDNIKQKAFHLAVETGNIKPLEKLWECARLIIKFTPEERNKFIMAKNSKRQSVFHLAGEAVLEKLIEWIRTDVNLTRSELETFLYSQDSKFRTVLHWAAENGKINSVKMLCNLGTSIQLTLKEMLSVGDKGGNTALHLAAKANQTLVLKLLVELVENETTENRFNLWLTKNNKGQTAWHLAAMEGCTEVLMQLWEWKKQETAGEPELLHKFWLRKDKQRQSSWKLAAQGCRLEILEKLWVMAKEDMKLSPEELKDLWLANNNGRSAFHWLTKGLKRRGTTARTQFLEKLCDLGKLANFTTKEMLRSEYDSGKNLWHLAVSESNYAILDRLWSCARDNLTSDERKEFLLDKSEDGQTSFHRAVLFGKSTLFEKLWNFGTELRLTQAQILLLTDVHGKSVNDLIEENDISILANKFRKLRLLPSRRC